MTGPVEYFRIGEDAPLPDIAAYSPFRAVVVLAAGWSTEWGQKASEWLVESGCLYMMGWGEGCARWEQLVDEACLERFDYGNIPDDEFVMTTSHDQEPLEEAFWFAGHASHHPDVELLHTLIIDIAPAPRRAEMIARFEAAQAHE